MKRLLGAVALSAALAVGGVARAGTADYTLSVQGSTTHNVNSSFDLSVQLENTTTDVVSGWSFGLCHDATLLDITGAADGATTAVVKNGSPPDFNQTNVIPGSGFTVGLVICLTGCATLAPGTGYELNVISYDAGATEGTGDVNFCDSIGIPPVATVIVVGGASIVPTQLGATIELVTPPPAGFDYVAPNPTATFDQASGTGAFTTQFSIAEQATSAGFPNETQGFSMGVAHDPSILAIAGGPTHVLPFSPDFTGPTVLANGWTIGVVYSFTSLNVMIFDVAKPVISVDYTISGLAGSAALTTPLTFSNTLGVVPVDNVVVVAGLSLDAGFIDGAVTLEPVTDTPFVRGDCNADQKVNIADGIWILNFMFQEGPEGTCAEACDADDSGDLEMTDAIYVIQYQLLNGPAPVAPFPACGIETGADCDASACP